MPLKKTLQYGFALALSLLLGSSARSLADDHARDHAEAKKPYPLTTCVVSGEKLGEMGEPKIIQYEGREVRFCCSGCEKDFRKDPQKYLKKLDEAAKPATTQPARIYTCSMHPDVKADKPGKCPKCHMDLTPAAPKEEKPAHGDHGAGEHAEHSHHG